MEITKDVLAVRIAGMTRQLGISLEQTAKLQGAIGICNELRQYLEAVEVQKLPEPDPPEPPEADPSAPAAAPAADERPPALNEE